MPKEPKPWLRKGRGYYVEINRRQIFLGKERGDAYRAFYALMAGNEQPKDSISEIVSSFSDWLDANRKPKTAKWYKTTLQMFLKFHPRMTVEQLKPFHVQQWMDSAEIASGTKRNYCRVIQRCMKWAEEQGYIEHSPIQHMKKPPAGCREVVISEQEYKRILDLATTIKPLIEFAWETGARASEILKIERKHLQGKRIVLPRSEEKMGRVPRIIYLSDRALSLVTGRKDGHLFLNSKGNPWKVAAVNSAFFRMKVKLGQQYCLTHMRHAFAHRMLTSGVDAMTVATLMGHANTDMISRVYGHLTHASEYLSSVVKAG